MNIILPNNMIEEYNQIVRSIVKSYAYRHYREIYNENIDDIDYVHYVDIHNYYGVDQWPVNINEDYYNLEDIILAEHLQIPCKCLKDYNERELEMYREGKEKDCNLFRYWKEIWKKNSEYLQNKT